MSYPYQQNTYPTFPDNSAEYRGTYPTNLTWSASKSPYYSIGDYVEYKGLLYRLNYNWDGTTVGSPDTQVDANGVRVWTLMVGTDENQFTQNQQFDIGYRYKTINSDSSFYYSSSLETTIIRYWSYWHNISSAHSTVFEQQKYKSDTESGFGRTLLDLASTVEINPLNTPYGNNVKQFQSINFNDANGIDNKMFFFLTSSCGHSNGSGPWSSPWGIFQYYGGFKKKLDLSDVGTLYYEEPFSYTLATTDWVLSPEYNATAYGPSVTVNWSYTAPSGTGYGETFTRSNLKMKFAGETFLGRTYSGAYRIYIKDNLPSDGRWELDSVTPDMRTM